MEAVGDPLAQEVGLIGKAQLAALPTHSEDDRRALVPAFVGGGDKAAAVVLDIRDLIGDDFNVQVLYLLLHGQHQVKTVDVGDAGVVFDDAAGGGLTPRTRHL